MKTTFVRYTLKLPSDVHRELSETASASGVTMLDMLLRIVRLGLYLAHETAKSPGSQIVIRTDGQEKILVPLLS
jgi:hypothetical protein